MKNCSVVIESVTISLIWVRPILVRGMFPGFDSIEMRSLASKSKIMNLYEVMAGKFVLNILYCHLQLQ